MGLRGSHRPNVIWPMAKDGLEPRRYAPRSVRCARQGHSLVAPSSASCCTHAGSGDRLPCGRPCFPSLNIANVHTCCAVFRWTDVHVALHSPTKCGRSQRCSINIHSVTASFALTMAYQRVLHDCEPQQWAGGLRRLERATRRRRLHGQRTAISNTLAHKRGRFLEPGART